MFLEHDKEFLTGLVLADEPIIIEQQELLDYSRLYKEGQLDKILKGHYKLMIFSIASIQELPNEEFQIGDFLLSKEQIIKALLSDNPEQVFDTPLYLSDDTHWLKAYLLGFVIVDGIMDLSNPVYFFAQYKKGNIMVYPETAVFKAMKLIPLSLIKSVIERIAGTMLVQDDASISQA